MAITTITLTVNLKIASDVEMTESDKEQVVSDLSYAFAFSEMLNENRVCIIDTEIVEAS